MAGRTYLEQTPPAASTPSSDATETPSTPLRTFTPSSDLPGSEWQEAARQLAFYRMSPTEIAGAIDALHNTDNRLADPALLLSLEEVTSIMRAVVPAVTLLREQATLYERVGVRVAVEAAEKANAENNAVEGAKPLTDAALTRIGDAARIRAVEYVALLESEVRNGETILRTLRRIHATRCINGDPKPLETPPAVVPAKGQADLNTPTDA